MMPLNNALSYVNFFFDDVKKIINDVKRFKNTVISTNQIYFPEVKEEKSPSSIGRENSPG